MPASRLCYELPDCLRLVNLFNVILKRMHLKVPPRFDFFASLIPNSFCSPVQLLHVVYVMSSDKLLNYLTCGQKLSEVKIQPLKTLEFHPY